MTDHVLEFTPWQSVGIFKFDDDITNYQQALSNWYLTPKNEYGVEHYHLNDDSRMISIRHGKIGSIFCYETLIYQGVNLIGLTIDEFKNITQSDYVGTPEEIDFEDDGYSQTIYNFDDIGARAWVKKNKIVTIIVAGKESYSDKPFDD